MDLIFEWIYSLKVELPPLEIPDGDNEDNDKKLKKPLQLWFNIPNLINAYCGNED